MAASMIKRFLPKSLLGRSLLIIVMPLVILQVISGLIFYESHWSKVSQRLARNVAGDIAGVISLTHMYPGATNRANIFRTASIDFAMTTTFRDSEILTGTAPAPSNRMEKTLFKALREGVRLPFRVATDENKRHVVIDVQLPDGVLRAVISRKRLFSSTTYVFVIWMVGSSLILFAVATIFMRNQVKPIRRLADAAEAFGKGRDAPNLKPEGATEVRNTAAAFIAMRERIRRQISQRTEMLAGVSHDLRTPLTRMKLQLEMAGNGDGLIHIKDDIDEMEHMLEGYLAFARGEGDEQPVATDLGGLLDGVVGQSRRKGGVIDLHVESNIRLLLRPNAFRRAATNLIENATRYAEHVSVRAGRRGDAVEITIDDDGPGIPEQHRTDVFKPFYRVDPSRNPETGGVGLGLTIARDVVRGNGGDIELSDSPGGGLRARIKLPV